MKVKKWHLILIVILIVIVILGFAVTIQLFKETNYIAKWIFNFLDDWASAGAPVFTLILAIAAFLAIWQTRNIQKSEKRQRLLNEIIEWAENISKCGIEPGIELYLNYRIAGVKYATEIEDFEEKSEKEIAAEIKHRKQLLSQYLRYSKKNKYMCKITLKINRLDNDMREVVKNLEYQIELLRKSLLDIEGTTTTAISLQMDKLVKSIENLIEQATDLKTKDIS